MKFRKIHKKLFGTKKGAYSRVTDREHYDSQITLVDYERLLVLNHFGEKNVHIGAVRSNSKLARKAFKLFPSGKKIYLNLVFPKPLISELRLYLSSKAGFKPKSGEFRFFFIKEKEIWIGSTTDGFWVKKDFLDSTFDQHSLLDKTSKIRKFRNREPSIGNPKPRQKEIKTNQYERDPEVRADILDRANGVCELCKKEAPFLNDEGEPFLEVHHIIPLSENGPDILDNAVGICPNCHREAHLGINRSQITKILKKKIKIKK
jgi:5-methylcytosine-specific restriction enzyme A